MLNYLEYQRPIPYSLNNSQRVSSCASFGQTKPRVARKAQKRKGKLAIAVIREGQVIAAKRISKKTACLTLELWAKPKVVNHKAAR